VPEFDLRNDHVAIRRAVRVVRGWLDPHDLNLLTHGSTSTETHWSIIGNGIIEYTEDAMNASGRRRCFSLTVERFGSIQQLSFVVPSVTLMRFVRCVFLVYVAR